MRTDSIARLTLSAPWHACRRTLRRGRVFVVALALLLFLAGCGPESSAPDPDAAGDVTVRDSSASATQPSAYAQVPVDHLPSVGSADTAAPGLAFAGSATGAVQAQVAEPQVEASVEAPAQAEEAIDYPCTSSTATVANLDGQRVTFLDGTSVRLDEIERVIGEIEVASVVFLTICTDDLGAQHKTIFVLQSPAAPSSPDVPPAETILVDNPVPNQNPAPSQEVTICHLPPGRANRGQTIRISTADLEAHLAKGDYPGECREKDPDDNARDDNARDDKDRHKHDDSKVTLCHIQPARDGRAKWTHEPRPRTMRVDASAVDAHLAHGDVLGACPDDDKDDDDKGQRNRGRGQGRDDDDKHKNRGDGKKKDNGKKKDR